MNNFHVDKCQAPNGCINRIDCLLIKECIWYRRSTYTSAETPLPKEEPIRTFISGASTSGNKPPYECLTLTFLRRSAERMQKGMHYGKHNWKKGAEDKAFILDRLNHALEHLVLAMEEIDSDKPMDDDNLAAVVVNCMFAMEFQVKKEK